MTSSLGHATTDAYYVDNNMFPSVDSYSTDWFIIYCIIFFRVMKYIKRTDNVFKDIEELVGLAMIQNSLFPTSPFPATSAQHR